MIDRVVRQISPKIDEADQKRLFSAFSERPNLVLLGAPGAGKTHLFTDAAESVGRRVTMRDFLNIPSFPSDSVLFIDALDESRAGRGDQSTIDAVVKKLFKVQPKKVRISCRENDWLGETDLAAFKPYFDSKGGVVVLALQHLTDDEQRDVLTTQGVTNPEKFIKHAVERGLEDLLTNPQNLVMLAKAVSDGNWPINRTELFKKSTSILLSEHNPSRARSRDGIYLPDELRDPAGAVLATRLISDVGGVSLTDHQADADYPSYRTAPFNDLEKIRAALGRRVFVGNGDETVDYTHRTTAEYLGAEWLSRQINGGLPLGRVRALIGINGHPAPELRGLHAWLAVLCPSHADELIDADPYGVLTYGDASSLSTPHRKRLLASLAHLSEIDPWFNRNYRTSSNLGALCSKDLVLSFRTILRSKDANFALKMLVLSALSSGEPLASLDRELIALISSRKEPYAIRSLAFSALKNIGATGIAGIKKVFLKLGNSDSDIRLRAEIISEMYQEFKASDVINLLNDTLDCPSDLPGGALWFLAQAVSPKDAPAILAGIDVDGGRTSGTAQTRARRHNAYDVTIAVSRLILRYLQEFGSSVSADALWKMLSIRRALAEHRNQSGSEDLCEELSRHPALVRPLFGLAIDELEEDKLDYRVLWKFREATVKAVDENALAELMSERARSGSDSSVKQAFIYEMAIHLALINGNPSLFEGLYWFGETRSDLLAVRTRNIASTIEEWRQENAVQQAEDDANKKKGEASTRQAFDRDQEAIRSGKHTGWMTWLGRVYFEPYEGTRTDDSAHATLEQKIGVENLPTALAGLRSVVEGADLPSVKDVARAAIKNSYPYKWYAPMAGMDERWSVNPTLSGLSDNVIRSLVAIKLVMHTERLRGNVWEKREHKWLTAIIQQRPELALDVYFTIASAALSKRSAIVSGLHELLSDDSFSEMRSAVTLRILKKHPAAPIEHLERILKAAMSLPGSRRELGRLAEKILGGKIKLDAAQRELWLSTAYLIDQKKNARAISNSGRKPAIFWRLRSLISTQSGQGYFDLSISQLETIIKIGARHFPQTSHPSGVFSGDDNPWDASETIHNLINHVSTLGSEDASAMLRRLIMSPSLSAYRDAIKHALANQAARSREAEYRQPNWEQAVSALQNGAPANFADLHALVLDHCNDLNKEITNRNIDIYRQFWNEGPYGRISTPRSEETSRDILVGLLQARLRPHRVSVEPEGHMAADKRVDVSVALNLRKTMMELKRDYHSDVWHAHETQLDRLYTPDPDASGYGIYGIFWFGSRRPRNMPARPDGGTAPQSAAEMQLVLTEMIPVDKRAKLSVVVFDVSGPVSGSKRAGGKKRNSSAIRTKSKAAGKRRKRVKVK